MFQIFSHWALTSPKVISFNTAVEATEKDLHVAPGGFFSSSERSSFHSATAGKSQFFVTYYRYMGRVHPFSIGLLEENQQDIELLRHQIRLVLLMVNHLLSQIRETVVQTRMDHENTLSHRWTLLWNPVCTKWWFSHVVWMSISQTAMLTRRNCYLGISENMLPPNPLVYQCHHRMIMRWNCNLMGTCRVSYPSEKNFAMTVWWSSSWPAKILVWQFVDLQPNRRVD